MTKELVSIFHIFHKWSKWETCAEGKLLTHEGDHVGVYIRQKRQCSVCGLIELKQQDLVNP